MIAIPGYVLIDEIGHGGMATVYRARQQLLEREVALKVLDPHLAASNAHAERFLQEARLLAALEHPHIVRVFDVGVTEAGLYYFSMQLLPGGDLAHRLRMGMSEEELERVLLATADALGFAHQRGCVHRDVTPANVLFDRHDEPVLTDFGIARVLAVASRLTPTGLSIGTCVYMSPEQAQGLEVDARSDIYSLGVLTYEAVSGAPPFAGEDAFAVAQAHVCEPVPPLPDECARWQPVIAGALAKDPDLRFQDAAAFMAAVEAASPVHPQPVPVVPLRARDGRLPKPPPVLVWSAVAAGIAALVVTAIVLMGGDADPQAQATTSVPPPVSTSAVTVPTAAGPRPAGDPASSDPIERIAGDIDTAQAIALGEVPTVRDPVAELLALGRRDLAAQRLTRPAGRNALERYELALVIEPGNAQAQAGIAEVARAYLGLAQERRSGGDEDGYLEFLGQAEALGRTHTAAAPVAEQASEQRQARSAAAIADGDAAAAAWDRRAAIDAYRQALRYVPDHPGAVAGIAAAERIGTRGWRFRDALAGGGEGPEMVVVNGLAMARTEVTVEQFRRFWQAEPAAAELAQGQRCRDRESFFRSSSRRSWQAPDIEQRGDHPVVCVGYALAQAYADWLSRETGQAYRLPTAAQWRAAGGGQAAACGAGNLADAAFRGRFGGRDGLACDDGHAATAPVARFAARGAGLYDLAGNVREWVRDCEKPDCDERGVAGGSWAGGQGEELRWFAADSGYNTVGFRLVRDLRAATPDGTPDNPGRSEG